jgi:hypothetical protein
MGYRVTVAAVLITIVGDMILTIIRPTWTNVNNDQDTVVEYVLLVVHCATSLLQAVSAFALFANTIWFTAGLLGDLFTTVAITLPLWVLRLILVVLPWVYRTFLGNGIRDRAFDDGLYVALYVADQVSGMALWVALLYTMCCFSESTMYSPYHKEAVVAELMLVSAEPGDDAAALASMSGRAPTPMMPPTSSFSEQLPHAASQQ